jgi:hypothetical protein
LESMKYVKKSGHGEEWVKKTNFFKDLKWKLKFKDTY